MFEQAGTPEPRNPISDWVLRGGIAFFFISAGAEKFQPMWIKLFKEIGLGQWFRYFTGVVEILGGLLVLIPWTANIGLALLACTMGSAAFILIFVVGRPADSFISGPLCIALSFYIWNRRTRNG